MPVMQHRDKLLVWASDIEEDTIQQALRTARMPFIVGDVALMPDAHIGFGSTVGSVFATKGAIIPSAIGVDIGCGMIAVQTNLFAEDLPDNLDPLFARFEELIPAGVGQGNLEGHDLSEIGMPLSTLSNKQETTAACQLGSLGSGNHFLEVCLDQNDSVWVVLHSGSRGIGNQLATKHIDRAKGLMRDFFIKLEDPALAYLVEGTTEFDCYIGDMLWAQDYARLNRDIMMNRAVKALFKFVGIGTELDRINCHHNFTQRENHRGKNVWVTRKGAIKADRNDWGVIPGSMGTASYIIKGLGNKASLKSCSHGAGRRMSRRKAKETLSKETLRELMAGQTWNSANAKGLVDEHPLAYKDIDQVMADQSDLAEIRFCLTSVLNYKGVK